MSISIKSSYLIIGGDGFIGGALKKQLKSLNQAVLSTTRHKDRCSKDVLFLDFSRDIEYFEIPDGIDVAYVCAAEANISRCEENPDLSYCINTLVPTKLIKKLVEEGIFVVFLSSSAVFDGTKPFQKADATLSPKSEYGRQKAETEQMIHGFRDEVLIIRPTKVLSSNTPLIKKWLSLLSNGEEIRPFKDLSIAPIHVYYLIDALIEAGNSRQGGVLQISGSQDISYEDLAYAIADKLGFSKKLIHPISVNESGENNILISPYTSLDMQGFQTRHNIYPQTLSDVLHTMISEQIKKNGE